MQKCGWGILIDGLFILHTQHQRPPPLCRGHFCDTVYICTCLWRLYWTILPSLLFPHMHSRLVRNVKGISITSLYFRQQFDRLTDTYTCAYNYTSIHNLKTIMSIYEHICACTFWYVYMCVLVCVCMCMCMCMGMWVRVWEREWVSEYECGRKRDSVCAWPVCI